MIESKPENLIEMAIEDYMRTGVLIDYCGVIIVHEVNKRRISKGLEPFISPHNPKGYLPDD